MDGKCLDNCSHTGLKENKLSDQLVVLQSDTEFNAESEVAGLVIDSDDNINQLVN